MCFSLRSIICKINYLFQYFGYLHVYHKTLNHDVQIDHFHYLFVHFLLIRIPRSDERKYRLWLLCHLIDVLLLILLCALMQKHSDWNCKFEKYLGRWKIGKFAVYIHFIVSYDFNVINKILKHSWNFLWILSDFCCSSFCFSIICFMLFEAFRDAFNVIQYWTEYLYTLENTRRFLNVGILWEIYNLVSICMNECIQIQYRATANIKSNCR